MASPKYNNLSVSMRGYWNQSRDKQLIELVSKYKGQLNWNQLSAVFPGVKGRHIKQRWKNHLDPSVSKSPWTWQEDQILKKSYLKFRNNWAIIAQHLPGRTVLQIRSRLRSQSFSDLFPTNFTRRDPPRHRPKAATPPTPTIAQDMKNHYEAQKVGQAEMKKEIAEEGRADLVQEEQPSSEFIANHERRRHHSSKRRSQQLTTLYLLKIYRLIRNNLQKEEPSQFYRLWQGLSRKEVLLRIRDLHWVMCQLWPMINQRPNQVTIDQDVSFLIFALIRADNSLSNEILHRVMKCCGSEDYLLRKVEKMIEQVDSFINQQLVIIKDRRGLERYNTQQLLKINIDGEDSNSPDPVPSTPKREGEKGKRDLKMERLSQKYKLPQEPSNNLMADHINRIVSSATQQLQDSQPPSPSNSIYYEESNQGETSNPEEEKADLQEEVEQCLTFEEGDSSHGDSRESKGVPSPEELTPSESEKEGGLEKGSLYNSYYMQQINSEESEVARQEGEMVGEATPKQEQE